MNSVSNIGSGGGGVGRKGEPLDPFEVSLNIFPFLSFQLLQYRERERELNPSAISLIKIVLRSFGEIFSLGQQ